MANSLISMVKGDSTLINNTEVLNGQILFDETKQKIFLDDNAKRKEYGGSDDNAVKKDDVAYVESAMVATRGYSAGNYIIVQDTLYKATTQINSGTALVVGTNVSTTTVGNELTQINNDLGNKVNNSVINNTTEDDIKKSDEIIGSVKKIGSIKRYQFRWNIGTVANQTYTYILSYPNEDLPNRKIEGVGSIWNGLDGVPQGTANVSINPDGTLGVSVNATGTNDNTYITFQLVD